MKIYTIAIHEYQGGEPVIREGWHGNVGRLFEVDAFDDHIVIGVVRAPSRRFAQAVADLLALGMPE